MPRFAASGSAPRRRARSPRTGCSIFTTSAPISASGRVLMAFTGGTGPLHEEVRARGWYLSLGERDPEVAAIAAPIFGRGQHFLGALGVIGPRNRFETESRDNLAALISEEAGRLSRGLGG